MNKIESFSSQLITLIFLLANISNNSSGSTQTLILIILYALIFLQISTLVWSVISRSIIANQDSIVQLPFFKRLSQMAQIRLKINSYIYLKLKRYSPILFKMLMKPSSSRSFDKFINWRKLSKKIKTLPIAKYMRNKEELLLESSNLKSQGHTNNSKKLNPNILQESIKILLFFLFNGNFLNKRNSDEIIQRKTLEKQQTMMESEKVSIERQSSKYGDEDYIYQEDETDSNQNTIRDSKIGPSSKLAIEQKLNFQNIQSEFHVLSNFSPQSMRAQLSSPNDSFFLSGQDLNRQIDHHSQKSQ